MYQVKKVRFYLLTFPFKSVKYISVSFQWQNNEIIEVYSLKCNTLECDCIISLQKFKECLKYVLYWLNEIGKKLQCKKNYNLGIKIICNSYAM